VAGVDLSVVALLAEWQVAFREGRQGDVMNDLVGIFPELGAGGMTAAAVVKRASA
jgi:hypothetical protein